MGSQQNSFAVDLNRTDSWQAADQCTVNVTVTGGGGGGATSPTGNIGDFTSTGYIYTCPTTEQITFTCSGFNGYCGGSTSVQVPPQCGSSETCGLYPGCGTEFTDSVTLSCECTDSRTFSQLGGCNGGGLLYGNDENIGTYNGCPQVNDVYHINECGVKVYGTCGSNCNSTETMYGATNECDDTFDGSCQCEFVCPTNCSSGYSYGSMTAGVCSVDCDGCPAGNCYTGNSSTYCCDPVDTYQVYIDNIVEQSVELITASGIPESQEFRFKYRRGLVETLENVTIYLKNNGTGMRWEIINFDTEEPEACWHRYLGGIPGAHQVVASAPSTRFVYVPEEILSSPNTAGETLGSVLDAISTSTSFRLEWESSTGFDGYSSNFDLVDEVRVGCTDPDSTQYDATATYDNGTCGDSEGYLGCTDQYAANYSCLTDGNANPNLTGTYACGGSSPAEGSYNYTEADITDNGGCQYLPVSNIAVSPSTNVSEGMEITISGGGSSTQTSYGSDYGYSGGSLTYSWVLTDTENPSNFYESYVTDNPIAFTFQLPIFTGTDEGGGGILYIELTVTNDDGWVDSESIPLAIGDVDILGTELSSFSSIYIPGGNTISLVGCYLPPLEGGYVMADVLNASFYSSLTNPDEAGITESGTFQTGDTVYVKICLDADCIGESLLNGFFNYITGIGWAGPDIPLLPGMGLQIETTNAGWFKWTEPA